MNKRPLGPAMAIGASPVIFRAAASRVASTGAVEYVTLPSVDVSQRSGMKRIAVPFIVYFPDPAIARAPSSTTSRK
jgi:hypothetical protein